ncbi:MAG: pilus assembly protein PilM [Planctomycetota bacterium]|jgi:type IV pilus assembly protein PilM
MDLRIVRGKALPVGVDLGSSAVKLAQLKANDGGIDLLAIGEADVPRSCLADPASRLDCFCNRLRDVLNRNTFRGRQAALSLPAGDTSVLHVKIPKLPSQEVPSAIESELRGKLPYAVEDAVVRHVIVGDVHHDDQTKQEAIVVAVSRGTLEDYLHMAGRAKLDVIAVNAEPFAVVECFARLFRRASDSQRAVLFVDMGATSTQVALAHGGRTVFARNLPAGGDQFDQAVAEKMDVPLEKVQAMRRDLIAGTIDQGESEQIYAALEEPLDSLAGEMTKCLRYYESVFRNHDVERAVFVGGQASDKRLCQSLARRLALPAQIGDPLMRVSSVAAQTCAAGIDRRVPQPRWAVAVGLSLGAQQPA